MLSVERQNQILKLLAEKRRLSSRELEQLLPSSPATMRRDLTALESRGLLVRVHGGILHPHALRAEVPFSARQQRDAAAKQRIAEQALPLLREATCIYVDAGSVCLQVGLRLLDREGLTLLTNSIPLLHAAQGAAARIVCLGGELKQVSMALVGSQALAEMARLRPQIAVIGATGLHPTDGPSGTDLHEANLKQRVMERAGATLLAAESAKWNVPAPFGFARWEQVRWLVSDSGLDRAAQRTLKQQGVLVHLG